MTYRIARAVLASTLVLATLSPYSARADNSDPENEVLVPGTRLQQAPFKLPASISIIDAERISTTPAETVADLLALEAGINVRSLYGNRSVRATVDLRGFGVTGDQNTLILLDGRRLNDVDLASVNFAALPLHNIERIEILRGSGSVLYGDGASGGAINIVTRRPRSEDLSGVVGLSGGSYDTSAIEGRLSYGRSKAGINLAAEAIESDGYRSNNDLTQGNVQLELTLDHSWGNFYAKTGFSDQELGLPGVRRVDPLAGLDELNDDRRGTASPRDFAEERLGFFTVGFSRALGEHAGLLVDAGYRDRDQEAFFDDYAGFPPFLPAGSFADFLHTRLRSWSFTPRMYFDHSLIGDQGRLTAGIDYYNHDYDSDRSLNPQTIRTPIHRLGVTQRNSALYLTNLSRINDKLTADLGVRLQRVRFTARDSFDAAAPGALDKFESGAPGFSDSHTEYMMEGGARYALTEQWEAFGRLGRSARFGTVDELYEFGTTFTREFSALEPQTARHLDAGLAYGNGAADGSLTVYAMELENEIHFNPMTFANENLDPTRRRGIELDVGVQAGSKLKLRMNYTVQRATFRDGPFHGNDVPLAPHRLANVSALWSIVPDVQLAIAWRHTGERAFDNDETASFGQRIPAYEVLDAKLSTRWRQWGFALTLNNILDEKTFDYAVASAFVPGRFNAYPLPERSVIFKLIRNFD